MLHCVWRIAFLKEVTVSKLQQICIESVFPWCTRDMIPQLVEELTPRCLAAEVHAEPEQFECVSNYAACAAFALIDLVISEILGKPLYFVRGAKDLTMEPDQVIRLL